LYAVKKIKLHPGDSFNQKMLREVRESDAWAGSVSPCGLLCVCHSSNAQVTTLSRLNHQYVVRYFQAWTEGGKSTLNWLVTQ
jgi:hypothetical protein